MTASTSPSDRRIVPDEFGLLPEVVRDGVQRVVIAIAAGKDDDAKFHGGKNHFSKFGRRD